MIHYRPALEQRILASLQAVPPRIPWLVGATGTGRSSALLHIRETLGHDSCHCVNVERCATTPERFHAALTTSAPTSGDVATETPPPASARDAFDATLSFFQQPRREHGATFLLDEVLEFRTFESFPGLRHTLRELVAALAHSSNRFVLSSRFVNRTHRLLKDAPDLFEPIPVPPLTAAEVRATLPSSGENHVDEELDELSGAIQALAAGRPLYVQAICDTMRSLDDGAGDPVGALSASLMPGAVLSNACHSIYELRLHRARGYGALKAILEVLAQEEPLTLTAIAQRLHRTPGSTKDYLTWLEDVDLIRMDQKKYSFTDPLLRLWVRLHCQPSPPSLAQVAHEVQEYASARLPRGESRWVADKAPAPPAEASTPVGARSRKSWEIVEFD